MFYSGLAAYFPMDEVIGDIVPSHGMELVLVGAIISSESVMAGALQIQRSTNGWANGMFHFNCQCCIVQPCVYVIGQSYSQNISNT